MPVEVEVEETIVETATTATEEIVTIEHIAEMARSTVERAKLLLAMPIEKIRSDSSRPRKQNQRSYQPS